MAVNGDAVVRAAHYKYLHPKEVRFVSCDRGLLPHASFLLWNVHSFLSKTHAQINVHRIGYIA